MMTKEIDHSSTDSLSRKVRLVLIYWAPAMLYATLIALLSSNPSPERYFPDGFAGINDKVVHVIEYAILGILCFRVFRFGAGPRPSPFAVHLAILTAGIFGLTDEIHQSFIPTRVADEYDFLADCTGALIGSMSWEWIHKSRLLYGH